MIRTFSFVGDAGLDAYVRVFNGSGQAFDFDDNTFKSLASCTTPYQTMTERSDVDGTSRSGYVTSLDLGAIHDGIGLQNFIVQVYDNAAPADSDVAVSDPLGLSIELGDAGKRQLIAWAKVSVKSAAGNDAQITAWLEADGQPVEVHEINGAAFTADAGTDVVTSNGHNLSDTDAIVFTTSDTLPAGLSLETVYYVRDATANTFKVAATSGGAAINITDAGTGIHKWHKPTATVTLREHGSGSVLFTLSMTAADLANVSSVLKERFEAEQASPSFTDDRQFAVDVSISVGGETVTTSHEITVIG